MKGFIEFLAMFGVSRAFNLAIDLLKGIFLKRYISCVEFLRSIYFAMAMIFAFLILLMCGFILLHIALFLILPWSMENKIILLFSLGAAYCIASLVAIFILQSRARWLKISGAKKMIDDLTKK